MLGGTLFGRLPLRAFVASTNEEEEQGSEGQESHSAYASAHDGTNVWTT